MAVIYLVRHGQTKWNREEVFRGQADIPLNDFGRCQAEALGKTLRNEELNNPVLVASPLKRATETAEIVSAHLDDISISKDSSYLDISYGEWEGKPLTEIRKKYPELYQAWLKHPEEVIFPGGETLKNAADRAEKGIFQAVKNNPEGHTIIFAHRAINKVLLCRLLGLGEQGFWKIRQDTACLNELAFSNRSFILVKLNDTCHLRDMERDAGDF